MRPYFGKWATGYTMQTCSGITGFIGKYPFGAHPGEILASPTTDPLGPGPKRPYFGAVTETII